jgi:hypothetical protein
MLPPRRQPPLIPALAIGGKYLEVPSARRNRMKKPRFPLHCRPHGRTWSRESRRPPISGSRPPPGIEPQGPNASAYSTLHLSFFTRADSAGDWGLGIGGLHPAACCPLAAARWGRYIPLPVVRSAAGVEDRQTPTRFPPFPDPRLADRVPSGAVLTRLSVTSSTRGSDMAESGIVIGSFHSEQ